MAVALAIGVFLAVLLAPFARVIVDWFWSKRHD